MNIDLNSICNHERLAIVGHGHADFDAMTSGYLLEHVLRELDIPAVFVLQDGLEDEFFPAKAAEVGFKYEPVCGIPVDAPLFLVDHTGAYANEVIACFDHHPTIVDIPQNYVNQPQTCCAKIIYDWATGLGVEIPDILTKLVIYACHMDSLSFKSSKALLEDRVWCQEMMTRLDMDEQEVVMFGYGITNPNQDYHSFITTGLKSYDFGNKKIKASYAVTAGSVDEDLQILNAAAEYLKTQLTDEVIAWCYLIQNAAQDWTHVVLVEQDRCVRGAVDRVLSRGKDVIPAVMNFLSK